MFDRAAIADAVAFWERGRLGYNGVLALVVIVFAMAANAWIDIGRNFGAVIVLGAIANVLYCAAYPLDLLAQATPAREAWRRHRWIAWALGTLLSVLLAMVAVFGIGVSTLSLD